MASDDLSCRTLFSSCYLTILLFFFLLFLIPYVNGEKQDKQVTLDQRPVNEADQMNSPNNDSIGVAHASKHGLVGEHSGHLHGSLKEDEQFNSSKHEVPSGPNPVSNR